MGTARNFFLLIIVQIVLVSVYLGSLPYIWIIFNLKTFWQIIFVSVNHEIKFLCYGSLLEAGTFDNFHYTLSVKGIDSPICKFQKNISKSMHILEVITVLILYSRHASFTCGRKTFLQALLIHSLSNCIFKRGNGIVKYLSLRFFS